MKQNKNNLTKYARKLLQKSNITFQTVTSQKFPIADRKSSLPPEPERPIPNLGVESQALEIPSFRKSKVIAPTPYKPLTPKTNTRLSLSRTNTW